MKISFTHSNGIDAEIPQNDVIAEHAVNAYGFVLNTPERRNKEHTGIEFAIAINDVFGKENPQVNEIIKHITQIN